MGEFCRVCKGTGDVVYIFPARTEVGKMTRLGYSADKRLVYMYGTCRACKGRACSGPSVLDVNDWAEASGFQWPETERTPCRGFVSGWLPLACDQASGEIVV